METQAKKTVCIDVHVPFGPNRGGHRFAAPAPKASDEVKRAYVQAMVREVETLAPDLDGARVAAVHLCGNGPWALPEGGLGEVLSAVRSAIGLAEDAEVLLDALPGRLTPKQLAQAVACGVNRIDVELASSGFAEAQLLDLPYDIGDFRHTACMLATEGFREFGATVLAGAPAQTEKGLLGTLLEVQSLGAVQVALEPFLMFEGTALGRRYHAGEGLGIPGPTRRASLLIEAGKALGRYGYQQVDNLTFAFEGHRSKLAGLHRDACETLGVGCGARSWYDGFAYRNTTDIARYIESSGDPASIYENVRAVDGQASERRRAAGLLGHPDGIAEPVGTPLPCAEELAALAASGLVERVEHDGGARWRKTPLGIASPHEFELALGAV